MVAVKEFDGYVTSDGLRTGEWGTQKFKKAGWVGKNKCKSEIDYSNHFELSYSELLVPYEASQMECIH